MKALAAVAIAMFLTLMLATTASAAPNPMPARQCRAVCQCLPAPASLNVRHHDDHRRRRLVADAARDRVRCAWSRGTICVAPRARLRNDPDPNDAVTRGEDRPDHRIQQRGGTDADTRCSPSSPDNQLGRRRLCVRYRGPFGDRHPSSTRRSGQCRCRLDLQATSDAHHRRHRERHLHRRRAGVQRLLAGRQRGDTGHRRRTSVGTISRTTTSRSVTASRSTGRLLAAEHGAGAVTLIHDTITGRPPASHRRRSIPRTPAAAQAAADQAAAAGSRAQAAAAQLAATQAAQPGCGSTGSRSTGRSHAAQPPRARPRPRKQRKPQRRNGHAYEPQPSRQRRRRSRRGAPPSGRQVHRGRSLHGLSTTARRMGDGNGTENAGWASDRPACGSSSQRSSSDSLERDGAAQRRACRRRRGS